MTGSPSTAVFELRSCPNFKGTSTPSRRMILSGRAVEAPPEGVAEVAAGGILGDEHGAGAAGEVSAGAAGLELRLNSARCPPASAMTKVAAAMILFPGIPSG